MKNSKPFLKNKNKQFVQKTSNWCHLRDKIFCHVFKKIRIHLMSTFLWCSVKGR